MATKRQVLEDVAQGRGCLGKAQMNCPVFVLVGTDPLAAEAVEMWATRARVLGVPNDKVQEAYACAEAMDNYRTKKVPD